jgi:hypothetical protein
MPHPPLAASFSHCEAEHADRNDCSLQVRCAPEDAYGPYDETNVVEVPLDRMPEPPPGLTLESGLVLQVPRLCFSVGLYDFF